MWIFIYNLLIKKYFFSNYSLRLKKINWKAKNCVSQFIKFVIINNARVNSFFLIYLFIKDNFSEKGSLFFNKNIFKYFTVNFIFRCLVYLLTGLPYLFIKKNIEFIDKLNSIYVLRRSLENYKKLSNASVLKAILTLTIQNCSIQWSTSYSELAYKAKITWVNRIGFKINPKDLELNTYLSSLSKLYIKKPEIFKPVILKLKNTNDEFFHYGGVYSINEKTILFQNETRKMFLPKNLVGESKSINLEPHKFFLKATKNYFDKVYITKPIEEELSQMVFKNKLNLAKENEVYFQKKLTAHILANPDNEVLKRDENKKLTWKMNDLKKFVITDYLELEYNKGNAYIKKDLLDLLKEAKYIKEHSKEIIYFVENLNYQQRFNYFCDFAKNENDSNKLVILKIILEIY